MLSSIIPFLQSIVDLVIDFVAQFVALIDRTVDSIDLLISYPRPLFSLFNFIPLPFRSVLIALLCVSFYIFLFKHLISRL